MKQNTLRGKKEGVARKGKKRNRKQNGTHKTPKSAPFSHNIAQEKEDVNRKIPYIVKIFLDFWAVHYI